MNKKIFNFFEIAAKTATSKSDGRSFLLGAIGIRKDGTMVRSLNSPTQCPERQVHAECKLCKKLDFGATVYVARVRLDNFQFGLSRPCFSCQKIMRHKGVKKAYYTISPTEFGVLNFIRNSETIFIKSIEMKLDISNFK